MFIYLLVYLSVCLSTCLKLYIWLFIYLVVYLPLLSWCIAVYSVQCKPINYSCLSFRINWPRIPGENSKGFWKRVLAASSLNKLPCPYSDFVERFRFSGFLFYYSIVNSSNKNTYLQKNVFSTFTRFKNKISLNFSKKRKNSYLCALYKKH